MALDRQSIEKRDFPISRRGYDPDAVDAHLALLADEVESLKRSAGRQRGDTLALAASEQVRLIVEAAEQSAADIEREADLEARRIRQEAREAAEKLRTEAGSEAREHVQRVAEACAAMLERIDSMDTELRGVTDNLRSGTGRMASDLSLLQRAVADLRSGAGADDEDDLRAASRTAAAPGASREPALAEPAEAAPADQPTAAESDNGEKPADEEGARLIALNMALNGTPREETERYLADNFELDDPESLLDDVYARAGQ